METAQPRRRRGWIFWSVATFLTCTVLIGLTVAIGYGYFLTTYVQDIFSLRNAYTEIRERGEPLGGEAIDEFFQIKPDESDKSEGMLTALVAFAGKFEGDDGDFVDQFANIAKETPPRRPAEWVHLERASRIAEREAEALAKLRAALLTAGETRLPADYSRGISSGMPAPDLVRIRNARRLLVLQALCHYYRGEWSQVTDNVVALIQLAETLRREPFAVAQLVRAETWKFGWRLFLLLTSDPAFPPGDIERIGVAAEAVDFDNMYYIASMGERAMLFESFKLTFDELHEENSRDPETRHKPVRAIRPGDCRQTLEQFTRHVEASKLPLPERADAAAAARDQNNAEMDASAKRNALSQNIVASLLNQPLEITCSAGARAESERRALIAMCAVERFRRMKGDLPNSLAELAPDYLAEVPADPFDGHPLRYLVYPDKSYCIYSIAENRVDDRGDIEYRKDQGHLDFGLKFEVAAPNASTAVAP